MELLRKAVYLRPEQCEWLRTQAYKTRDSESEIMRQALDNFMEEDDNASSEQ